jgi:hypothetical protein
MPIEEDEEEEELSKHMYIETITSLALNIIKIR